MDRPNDSASHRHAEEEWTRLFVETVQHERHKREQHTTDTEQAIQQYTAAAERKIKEALGPNESALLPGSAATGVTGTMLLASRPKTKAR